MRYWCVEWFDPTEVKPSKAWRELPMLASMYKIEARWNLQKFQEEHPTVLARVKLKPKGWGPSTLLKSDDLFEEAVNSPTAGLSHEDVFWNQQYEKAVAGGYRKTIEEFQRDTFEAYRRIGVLLKVDGLWENNDDWLGLWDDVVLHEK